MAQTELAYLVDRPEALRLWRLAAAQGNASAQFELGTHFLYDWGGERNLPEAARLFKLAADQGSTNGLRSLATCLRDGDGISQDMQEALRLLRLASNLGDAASSILLGILYEYGESIAGDLAEAARLYKLAADDNDETGLSKMMEPNIARAYAMVHFLCFVMMCCGLQSWFWFAHCVYHFADPLEPPPATGV
eukprot:m.170240 g.170240  ORF g.170240 m.170240 type:complete len:192 (+) comp10376_c0_seq3:393-968(+)